MKKLVLALASLLAAGCGDPFQASVSAKQVCVRQLDEALNGVTVPAGIVAPPTVRGSMHQEGVQLDTSDLKDLDDSKVAANLGLQSFKLTSPAVSGIEQLRIVLVPPPGSTLQPLTLIDYPAAGPVARADATTISGDLTPQGKDLMEYVRAGDLTLRVDASGNLPTSSWSADLEVCASASASYSYL